MSRSTWAVVVGAAVIAVLVGALATRFGTDPNEVESPLVGTPVLDVVLPYIEGEGSVELTDVGDDILIVNFWASWCIPCRSEHPVLVDAAARWESAGVRVVGVLYQDDTDNATDFLDEFGRGYETVTDPNGRAAIAFGVTGAPETFIVDAAGVIRYKQIGPITPDIWEGTLWPIVQDLRAD